LRKLLPLLLLALAACDSAGRGEAVPGVSLLENFRMAESGAGAARWRLEADKGRMDEKNGLITFTSPRIRFYEDGKPTSKISSRAGSLKMHDKSAVLTDEVAVDSLTDGMRLVTTKLFYSAARGKIWTDEPLTIYKDNTVIKGRGFTANPDLSAIEIQRQETRMAGQ
jgi:LPS export ABC transporter protein LptC